jgi:hypothetical protein
MILEVVIKDHDGVVGDRTADECMHIYMCATRSLNYSSSITTRFRLERNESLASCANLLEFFVMRSGLKVQ